MYVFTFKKCLIRIINLRIDYSEPGDDIDEELIQIRLEEPEVNQNDLGKFTITFFQIIFVFCFVC